MFELHQTDVDGVRCFWVETGRPTLAAALVFRAGMADEPLPQSGWLHLLEHLSLHGRGGGALHVNGSVSLLHTTFDAHGPVESVVDHLAEVTSWLRAPAFGELERERGVLRAEAALRGGPGARLFTWRYGARGPGIISYEEPGLGLATPDLLTQRSHQVFTRGNAALILDGPPPAGLRLTLPAGDLIPPSVAVPCGDKLPAAYVDEAGVILSGRVSRSPTATVAQEILQRALHERLRDHEGAAYAPWAGYEPVDAGRALLFGGSDVLPTLYPTLVDSILDLVKRLRDEPVPDAWLAEVIESRHQSMRDPYFATALAGRAAHYHLMGMQPQTHEEVVAELLATTGDGVQETLREFAGSLLLGIPGKTTWRDQIPMLSFPETSPQREGRQFKSVDWPASTARLAVGPERIEISDGNVARAVNLRDIAGLFVFEDGGRHLVSVDGWGVSVEPSSWRRGADAVTSVDEAVPRHLHLPLPARHDPPAITGSGAVRRWWRGLRRVLRGRALAGAWALLMLVVIVVGAVMTRPIMMLGGTFALVATVRELRGRGQGSG